MNILIPNSNSLLIQSDLYKSYGQFNLYFESVVAHYRELLILLVRRYYGFNYYWENPETKDVIDENMQDRLMKIILNDDGAYSIIEKCRSCFLDITNSGVRQTLINNNIEPIDFPDTDIEFAKLLFKKGIELVKLRNIIIHAHYNGVVFSLLPILSLHGSKDIKTSKGYEERIYKFNISYFECINEQLMQLRYFIKSVCINISASEGVPTFSETDFDCLSNMDFTPPRIQ